MKDWILKILKKSLTFIVFTILTGVIWEIFRFVCSSSIPALGQAGNFLVNTYYSCAAQVSISVLIYFLVSLSVEILFLLFLFDFFRIFKRIKEIEGSKRVPTSEESISKRLKIAKVLLLIGLPVGTFTFVSFFVYILLPFHSKINFDNKITILKSVVSQEQICKLNARWRLMRSKNDYLKLMNDIKTIEENHKAELEKLSLAQAPAAVANGGK